MLGEKSAERKSVRDVTILPVGPECKVKTRTLHKPKDAAPEISVRGLVEVRCEVLGSALVRSLRRLKGRSIGETQGLHGANKLVNLGGVGSSKNKEKYVVLLNRYDLGQVRVHIFVRSIQP